MHACMHVGMSCTPERIETSPYSAGAHHDDGVVVVVVVLVVVRGQCEKS